MNPEIKIRNNGHTVNVKSPYDRDFIDFAHKMDAEWDGCFKVWKFSADDEEAVRDAAKRIYGNDGDEVRTTIDELNEVVRIVEGHENVVGVEIGDADTGNGYVVAHVTRDAEYGVMSKFIMEATPDGWKAGSRIGYDMFIRKD